MFGCTKQGLSTNQTVPRYLLVVVAAVDLWMADLIDRVLITNLCSIFQQDRSRNILSPIWKMLVRVSLIRSHPAPVIFESVEPTRCSAPFCLFVYIIFLFLHSPQTSI